MIFLCVVIAIVLLIFIAKEFSRIAAMKGHTESRYFWWSLFTGIPGWLMVIALPDFSSTIEKPAVEDEIPDI